MQEVQINSPTLVYHPATQCEGKRGHRTKAIAREAKKRMRRHIGKNLQVYYCVHCGFYHLGSPTKAEAYYMLEAPVGI